MSMLYWMILIVAALFGGFGFFGPTPYQSKAWGGFGLVLLILLALLGYRVFGSPVQ